MPTVIAAADRLAQLCLDNTASKDDINPAARAFMNEANVGAKDLVDHAISRLAPVIEEADDSRAAFIALVCGMYVEQGHSPYELAPPLFRKINTLLDPVASLCQRSIISVPDNPGPDDDVYEIFDQAKNSIIAEEPILGQKWDTLEEIYPAAIAVLSAAPDLRASCRAEWPKLADIGEWHMAAIPIARLLKILHQEPLLVLEPGTRRGILGHFSGIADNVQLHALLMPLFPEADGTIGISSEALAASRGGVGGQPDDVTIIGRWFMYGWQGLLPGPALPTDQYETQHRIWGEGTPTDIPLFDGRRVLLLAPPLYTGSWCGLPHFPHLSADITVEHTLSEGEVEAWLEKLLAARS